MSFPSPSADGNRKPSAASTSTSPFHPREVPESQGHRVHVTAPNLVGSKRRRTAGLRQDSTFQRSSTSIVRAVSAACEDEPPSKIRRLNLVAPTQSRVEYLQSNLRVLCFLYETLREDYTLDVQTLRDSIFRRNRHILELRTRLSDSSKTETRLLFQIEILETRIKELEEDLQRERSVLSSSDDDDRAGEVPVSRRTKRKRKKKRKKKVVKRRKRTNR